MSAAFSFVFFCVLSFSVYGQIFPQKTLAQRAAGRGEEVCKEIWTPSPPFHVSGAYKQGDKTYENFRSADDPFQKEAYIPRRSLVRIKPESEEYAQAPGYFVPVEVLGVNQTDFQEQKLKKAQRFRHATALRSGLERARPGQKGFLHTQALEPAGKFTYVVREDSPILRDNGLSAVGVAAIKPKTNDEGAFLARECCFLPSMIHTEKTCHLTHRFELVYADGRTQGQTLDLDLASCEVANSLIPFDDENADNIEGLLNFLGLSKGGMEGFDLSRLETLDSRGLARIPLDYDSYDRRGMKGPFGSYHYNVEGGGEDAYAHPVAGCVLLEVLKEHQKRCQGPGCQAQFGNLYNPPSWGTHSSHGDGDCVDFRPLRNEDSKSSLTFRHSDYDRDKTREFIKLLKEAGATQVIFNDPEIRKSVGGVSRYRGHDNHIHVCFDVMSEEVVDVCRNGIP